MISAEKITTYEICPRRYVWTSRYAIRISPIGALYRALDAGLRTENNPEQAAQNELLAIASNPGLDLYDCNIYAIATHFAWLAGIIAQALRNAFTAPWSNWGVEAPLGGDVRWRTRLYNAGDGIPRRIVLVDKWSDDRKASERRGWRTVAETVALGRPIAVTAIEIGSSRDKRRISPWTRCYRHPKNDTFRFRRLNSDEDFSRAWKAEWREDSGISTAGWLAKLQNDGCLDSVQTVNVPVPSRPVAFLSRVLEIAEEMQWWEEKSTQPPPMRLAGCNDPIHGQCPFLNVCHGSREQVPERYGFVRRPSSTPQGRESSGSGFVSIAPAPTGSGLALTPAKST